MARSISLKSMCSSMLLAVSEFSQLSKRNRKLNFLCFLIDGTYDDDFVEVGGGIYSILNLLKGFVNDRSFALIFDPRIG